MGRGLMPTIALVDFELTLSMPFRLTADSALDSLCHAMEAYVSRRANPFSDAHALAAMRSIPESLRAVRARAHARDAREALMVASCHAGLARAACHGSAARGGLPSRLSAFRAAML